MKKLIINFLPLIACEIAMAIMMFDWMKESSRNKLVGLMIILIIALIKLAVEIYYMFDEHEKYLRERKKIFRTYGFLLTKLEAIPNLKNYTVYKYDKLEQIVDKAMDFRINSYYLYDDKTVDFLLIEGTSLYIYSFKESPDDFSRVDKYFVEIQHQR